MESKKVNLLVKGHSMKIRMALGIVSIVLALMVGLSGCDTQNKGNLEFTLVNAGPSRAFYPVDYMDAGNGVFHATITSASLGTTPFDANIALGDTQSLVISAADDYVILITGKAPGGTLVASGSVSGVIVTPGGLTSETITVSELTTVGTLDLTLNWEPAVVNDPEIVSTRQRGTEPAVDLIWVDGPELPVPISSTCIDPLVSPGWYTVVAQIFDVGSPDPSGGFASLARVQPAQTTYGVVDVTAVPGGGGLEFAILLDLTGDWIDVECTIPEGTVALGIQDYLQFLIDNVGQPARTYTWYVNGVLTQTDTNVTSSSFAIYPESVTNGRQPHVTMIAWELDASGAGQLDWVVTE